MRKIIIIYSLFVISSFQVFSANILTDQAAIGQMIRSGVPAVAIKAAREQLTKDTIKNLIFAAAPVYPLAQILELYPHETSTSSSTPMPTGESAFYEECLKDVYLYEKFFLSLAGRYLEGTNPLRDFAQLQVYDIFGTLHGGVKQKKNKYDNVKHLTFPIFFLCFKSELKSTPNLSYLCKLLESEFPLLLSNRQRKIPDAVRDLSRNIRCYAPYMRGDLYLYVAHNLDKALENYQECLKEAGNRQDPLVQILQHFSKYKIAEIQLNSYYFDFQLLKSNLNPHQAIRVLNSFNKVPMMNNLSVLRLGQYYLGFCGGDIDEAKGIAYIEKITNSEINHIAYVVLAEYYLGITDPQKFNLVKASKFLDRAYEVAAEVPDYQEYVNLRRGELALGIYGEASEIDTEVDVTKAKEYFERDSRNAADKYLLAIYRGEYGNQYKNDQRYAQIFERFKKMNPEFADSIHAMQLYKAGKVDEAVTIFEREKNEVRANYFLGCIKSNPRFEKHFDEPAAMAHFYKLMNAGYNYRDTSARFIKLFLKTVGLEASDDVEKCWRYILRMAKKGDYTYSAEDLEKNGFVVSDEFKKTLIPAAKEVVSSSSSSTVEAVAESSIDQEEENSIRAEVEAVDPAAPVLMLEDPYLQKLYEDLGSKIRWRNLLNFVKEFGGTVNLPKKTMTFPHCEGVFTFHLPHSGNPLIDFTGYWRHLKNMIDHEYAEKCRAESEKALS